MDDQDDPEPGSEMTFRVGILGGGNISGTHAQAAREIPGVEVVAVWGRNAGKAAALGGEVGALAYGDLDEFLGHPMDAVLIGSPPGVHAEHARAAAERGLHVLVEKPLEISSERIDGLLEVCDRAKVKIGVFFQDRTAPEIAWLKRMVDAGGIGRPLLFSARVKWYREPGYYSGSRWRGTRALDGGGALMAQGSHTLDLLLWLLGDPASVYARTATLLHDIEVEDTVVACLEFPSGVVGTFEATTAAYPGYPRRVELTGTEGTVVLESDRIISADLRFPATEPIPREAADDSPRANTPLISDRRGHRRVIEDFIRAIHSDTAPLCDGRDARRSVAVAEAIYESARTGAPVSLREESWARLPT
jgi:UDP-N-acetyl-2-amino-2-deoxyglucuronate dehydrogenase